MRRLILFLLFFVMIGAVHAQFTYGTTGLLNMPTADMQRDKTFMFGGGFLEKHATPARWTYNTFNYYFDITIFPWLEVSYICTLHKAMEVDPAYGPGFWVPSTYGKFVNQDRNFAVRLRLWKEGWWKPWTPQIVLGANDALNNSWTEGSKIEMSSATANGCERKRCTRRARFTTILSSSESSSIPRMEIMSCNSLLRCRICFTCCATS